MTAFSKFMAVTICFSALAGWPSKASAHGLGWQQDFNQTLTLNFAFADGEPLAYSEVSIFSPDDYEFEYQKARSDQNGFFSFRPNKSGLWKFSAVDGQGHKTSGEIAVTEEQIGPSTQDAQIKAGAPSGGAASGSFAGLNLKSIILGLSLILNVALLARRRKAETSS